MAGQTRTAGRSVLRPEDRERLRGRAAEAVRRARRHGEALAERAACDDPDGPRGTGPVAVGGFAFAGDGGGAPHWVGYPPASLHVPEAALARRGDDVRLTLTALARPDDTPEDVVARLERRA